jgi:hypothetical protein
MNSRTRHDRTVRLISARLEEIAVAEERRPALARDLEHSARGAAAATRHAVELCLISRDEADAIWARVAELHPAVGLLRAAPYAA